MSNEELAGKLAEDLKTVFGDEVEVKYVDVDKVGLADYPAMNRVLQMGYPYPITFINGEPRYAGGILTEQIKESVKELLGK